MYQTEEEKIISKYSFKQTIGLREAAEMCLIGEDRLRELALSGFAPHMVVDGKHLFFKRKDLFNWAKENLVSYHPGIALPRPIRILEHTKASTIGLPEQLIPMAGKLKEFVGDLYGPCVYFLIRNQSVVYVGQSTSLSLRVSTHSRDKDFERVLYFPCAKESLNDVEASLIRALKPLYNLTQRNSELEDEHNTNLVLIGFKGSGG